MGWIRSIYSSSRTFSNPTYPTFSTPPSPHFKSSDSPEISEYREKLHQLVFETYTRARIDQLYNIIIEFPDSQPALEDLRDCLVKTNLRNFLTTNLRQGLDRDFFLTTPPPHHTLTQRFFFYLLFASPHPPPPPSMKYFIQQ